MRLSTALTLIPFMLVVALALGLGIAGRLSTHDAVQAHSSAPTRSEAVAPSPTATAAVPSPSETAASPSPSASPTATASAAPTAPSANDPSAMLRVHNDLRAAVGAPAVRADDRVTAAAQKHAEDLARN